MTEPNLNAGFILHWPTGPVNVCQRHLGQLQALARLMGVHAPVQLRPMPGHCINCSNEAEKEGEDAANSQWQDNCS